MSRTAVTLPNNRSTIYIPKGTGDFTVDGPLGSILVNACGNVTVDGCDWLGVSSVARIPNNRSVVYIGFVGPTGLVENIPRSILVDDTGGYTVDTAPDSWV